jgi:uncharacterized repeat protein (TIGR01451 family)
MPKFKKLALSLLAVLVLFPALAPQFRVAAGFGECGAATICFYKDVYDNAAKIWKTDSATAVPGDYINFNVGFSNSTGAPINNIVVKDTLPAGLAYTPVNMAIYGWSGAYTDTDLFGSGISIGTLANNQSFQVVFMVRVSDLPAGTTTLTNTGSVTYTGGSKSNTADVVVTSTGPTAGKVVVNEIDFQPRADWSAGGDYRLSGRTAIDNNDQWIEFFVKQNGLNLTTADWQLYIQNGGSNSTTQLLAAGSGFQYVSGSGGTQGNTKNGDYLLINNPLQDLGSNGTVRISYLGTVMDEISYNTSNTGLLDETLGRNASSLDTDNTSDFSKNHGTPGRANTARVDNVYEGEIYMASDTATPRGADVFDGAASEGLGVQLDPALDINGNVLTISTPDHNAAGAYKATLRLKTTNANLNGTAKFADFVVQYPDGLGGFKQTGFAIIGRDINTQNTYQDFTIEFRKPATTGNDIYTINFFTAPGTTVVIDKMSVVPFTPNNSLPITFEAENFHRKNGNVVNDGGTAGILGPKSEAPGHIAYGPYTASFTSGLNSSQFKAQFSLRFANITGAADAPVARLDIFDPQQNISRETTLRVADVTGGYAGYDLQFPAAGEGSFEFRVYNFGAADIYFDKITITSLSGLATWVYESENDFEYPNGAQVVGNAGASGSQEVVSTTAGNAAGWMQRGPFSLDQTGTGKYYQADFKLRTDAVSASSNTAANLIVRNFDTGQVVANAYVYANTLTTSYQDYKVIFKSINSGRIVFEVYFTDEINLFSDFVTVSELAALPNPQVSQAELLFKRNGTIAEDSLATNDIGHATGLAIKAEDGTNNNQVALYSDSQLIEQAGNYQATFYLRKTGPGSSSAPIIYLEVWDPFTNLSYQEVSEGAISNSAYTTFTLNFSTSGNERIYYKTFFVGGTGSSVLIDKVELNKL